MTSVQTGVPVVEWAPFRLAAGVTEETLLEQSDALQRDFLEHQPGFLRRELLKGSDGEWVDLVVWADAESAEAVIAAARESATCHRYFGLMQGGENFDAGDAVAHYSRVRTWE
jgi:hypothetical protein